LPKSRAQPRDPSPPVLCGSRTCKPNSVRNMNAAGRSFLWATHCCGAQATYPEVVARRASTRYRQSPKAYQEIPPYLVLLRVGFALPAALLRRRCALTAPFHPYLGLAARAVCFLWHFPSNRLEPALPDVIRHTALRSSDFPPTLRRATVRSGCQPIHYSAGDSAGGSCEAAGAVRECRSTLPTPMAHSLTPPLWAREGTCMSARPSRPATESIRRDRPARRSPAHAEAPLHRYRRRR